MTDTATETQAPEPKVAPRLKTLEVEEAVGRPISMLIPLTTPLIESPCCWRASRTMRK